MEKNKLLLVVDLLRNLIFSKRCIDAQLARPSGILQHSLVVSSDANCALMLKASYVASLLIILSSFTLFSQAIDLGTFQKPKALSKEIVQELDKVFKPSTQSDFYIFASLGLKKNHLKALIEDAKRFGGVVVVRGLKNNSFAETIEYLSSILKKEYEGVQINPNLFRQYVVKSVPTFVLANGDNFDCIRGNVTARFALSKMKEHGDLASAALERLNYER